MAAEPGTSREAPKEPELPATPLSDVYRAHGKNTPDELLAKYLRVVSECLPLTNKSKAVRSFIKDTVETQARIIEDTAEARRTPQQRDAGQPLVIPNRTIKLNELVIRPVPFDGQRPRPRRWLEDFSDAIYANGWDDYITVKYFPTFLVGSAKDWFLTVIRPKVMCNEITTWSQIRLAYISNYLGEADYEQLSQAVDSARQRPDESVCVFIPRFRRLALMLTPNLPESEQIRQIKSKLRPEYKAFLAFTDPRTIQQLNDVCLKIEAGFTAKARTEPYTRARSTVKPIGQGSRGPRESRQQDQRRGPPENRYRSDSDNTGNRRQTPPKECQKCNREGHLTKDCFARTRKDGTPIPRPEKAAPNRKTVNKVAQRDKAQDQAEDESVVTIKHVCNSVFCDAPVEQDNHIETRIKTRTDKGVRVVSSSKDQAALLEAAVVCNDETIRATVDTGAFSTVISQQLVDKYGWKMDKPAPQLVGADGSQLEVRGLLRARIEITLGSVTKAKTEKLVVIRNLTSNMLLGLQLMRALKIHIDTARSRLYFAKETVLPGIRTTREEVIPPRSQTTLTAQVNTIGTIMTVPFNFNLPLMVANSIGVVHDNRVPVLVVNPTKQPVALRANLQIATYEPVSDSANQSVNQVIAIEGTDESISIGEELDDQQAAQLSSLVSKYKQAFSIGGSLGLSTVHKHRIELQPEAKPFAEPLRRRALVQIKEIRRQVHQMLKDDIIEESNSPWASAVVLAKKKTGDFRLCIDYRKLNDVTKKWVYPLPNIEDCLETLAGKRYFSQIDFASGFWQVEMEENSKELTAFRTEDGQFQFKRMPFGLTNAPASFQRMINATLAGMKGINLQVFIDDVCIATETWREHLVMLAKFFELVVKSNLKIKASKCLLGAARITFLGHQISSEGIKQEPAKLLALKKLAPPTDTAGVKRTLGMFSYYRKFVPNFAMIAEPLTKLIRKNVEFVWGSEQQEAFSTLINRLLENATLAHFNHTDPVLLKTDASRKGVAGLLLQKQDNEWRIVTCCSRRLTSYEENYGITDLEGLALIYSVCKFRPYLLGKKFQILVDHCALCVLNKRTPKSARLIRWAILLSEYDFEIVYTRGDLHQDIDCLSRAPVNDETDQYLDDRVLLVAPAKISEWVEKYDDEESQAVLGKARAGTDGYQLINGVVYRNDLIYVPSSARSSVIGYAHSAPMSGHPGARGTRFRLREHYFWPDLSKDVDQYIKNCAICLLNKHERGGLKGEMHSFDVFESGEQVGVDCLGPLTKTSRGNTQVIVTVDMFSRFVDTKAVPDISGATFARYLIEYCGRYGVPRKILSDQSSTFCNALSTELANVFGARHVKSAPYHSQGNAIVERVIQTLQEKLRVVLNNPIQDTDWDVVLPIATLSINTSYHSSTGYTPYELTFGRKPPIQDGSICQNTSPHDLQARLVKTYLDVCRADAINNQAQAQEQSKPYFESSRKPASYNVGDLVAVKMRERSPKLAPKFRGPYRVVSAEKDVYKLEELSTNKTITRHVSSLRTYTAAVDAPATSNVVAHITPRRPAAVHRTRGSFGAILLSLFLIDVATPSLADHIFDTVPPLIYLTTDYQVEGGIVDFDVNFAYIDPCKVFDVNARQTIDEKNALSPASTDGQLTPAMEQRVRMYNAYLTQCSILYDKEWLRTVDELLKQDIVSRRYPTATNLRRDRREGAEHRQTKRSVSEFVTGAIMNIGKDLLRQGVTGLAANVVSNLIATAFDRYMPGGLGDRTTQLERRVHELTFKYDILREAANKTLEAVDELNRIVTDKIREINSFIDEFPQLTIAGNLVIHQIFSQGADLRKTVEAARYGKVETASMARLLNIPGLARVRNEDTKFLDVRRIADHTLNIKFRVVVYSEDTFVYRVRAFDHWDSLDETPEYQHYVGADLMIYNETSNCMKAVEIPVNKLVLEECTELDGTDPLLKKWQVVQKTFDISASANTSFVEKTLETNYIYCFPGKIMIDKTEHRCPLQAFKLRANVPFKTADRRHVPSRVQLNVNLSRAVDSVHAGHFDDDSDLLNELRMFDKLKEVRESLNRVNHDNFVVPRPGALAMFYAAVLSSTLLLLCACCWKFELLTACWSCVTRRSDRTLRQERHERKRTEMELNELARENRRNVYVPIGDQITQALETVEAIRPYVNTTIPRSSRSDLGAMLSIMEQ